MSGGIVGITDIDSARDSTTRVPEFQMIPCVCLANIMMIQLTTGLIGMLESRFEERRGRSQKAVEIVREVPCLFTSELMNLSKKSFIPIQLSSRCNLCCFKR